jgi:hypothetical protein
MLPIQRNPAAIDQRFIEYVLALTDGVTGLIIDLLRRPAADALGHKSKSVGIDELLIAGAHLPAIINQRANFRFRILSYGYPQGGLPFTVTEAIL